MSSKKITDSQSEFLDFLKLGCRSQCSDESSLGQAKEVLLFLTGFFFLSWDHFFLR